MTRFEDSAVPDSVRVPTSRPRLTVAQISSTRVVVPARRQSSERVEQAVHAYLTLVWQVLRRAGLRVADADDAAQDVFWVFAQRLEDVPAASTRAFLVATALRVASDRRKNKWNRSVTEVVENETFASLSGQPDEQAHLRRQTELLDQLLTEMSEEEREIFVLFEIEQMTRTEVAESLGIPEGTAASRLRRARESFERLLRRARMRTGRIHG